MADTLLFRGGSSADIATSTVQSREIVIDTDTDQIVSGASKKKTVMEDSSGNIGIGGGNIQLNADGSLNTKNTIISQGPANGAVVFAGRNPLSTNTSLIFENGSAEFTGDITCTDNSKGLVLKSPDGTSFRLSVANDGTLSASTI